MIKRVFHGEGGGGIYRKKKNPINIMEWSVFNLKTELFFQMFDLSNELYV